MGMLLRRHREAKANEEKQDKGHATKAKSQHKGKKKEK